MALLAAMLADGELRYCGMVIAGAAESGPGGQRVVLVTGAGSYVGPALSRGLAASGQALVLHGPAAGQAEALRAAGAAVEVAGESVVPPAGPGSLATAEGWEALVGYVLGRFGRLDAAALFPTITGEGAAFSRGPLLDADLRDLRRLCGYFEATFHALRAVIPAMRGAGGQIVVFTSDAGARPEAGWSLYGAVRAGQNFFVQAAALEHAADGICLNAIGSKNAVFPGFPLAPAGAITDRAIARGEWSAPLEAETPLGRLGTMDELAAFALPFLDGRNRFQTAQYFSFSGGWNQS